MLIQNLVVDQWYLFWRNPGAELICFLHFAQGVEGINQKWRKLTKYKFDQIKGGEIMQKVLQIV